MSTQPTDPEVRERVRIVATALLPELPEIGTGIAAYICDRVPEVAEANATEVVYKTCRANATVLLDSLMRGVRLDDLTPSAEVVQSTRMLVQVGLSLEAVMKAYRIGSHYWIDRWAYAVTRFSSSDEVSVRATTEGISFLLSWIELVTELLAKEYRAEAARLALERSFARADDVRRILTDTEVDVASASSKLGYRLTGGHIALVLRSSGDHSDSEAVLGEAVSKLARAVGTARPLAAHVDMSTTWCWISCSGDGDIRVPLPAGSVIVAQGRPGRGIDGFRRSHREALDALRVAELVGSGPGTVTFYEDVDIAVLCSADPPMLHKFISDELGPLAAKGERTRIQRRTLEAFLAANSNYRAAAASLDIHHNTVRYRIDQIEHALGHSLADRRLSLELALHLSSVIHPGM